MFSCQVCPEKDKLIEFLKAQNKDLHDRLMSFNERQFLNFKAEERSREPLYPTGVDKDGKVFSYKDASPEQAEEDVKRAVGEDVITVEDKK